MIKNSLKNVGEILLSENNYFLLLIQINFISIFYVIYTSQNISEISLSSNSSKIVLNFVYLSSEKSLFYFKVTAN